VLTAFLCTQVAVPLYYLVIEFPLHGLKTDPIAFCSTLWFAAFTLVMIPGSVLLGGWHRQRSLPRP
jgi:hypothetical protein